MLALQQTDATVETMDRALDACRSNRRRRMTAAPGERRTATEQRIAGLAAALLAETLDPTSCDIDLGPLDPVDRALDARSRTCDVFGETKIYVDILRDHLGMLVWTERTDDGQYHLYGKMAP